MADNPQNSVKKNILRIQQVIDMISLSKSMIYAKMDPKSSSYDPTFPRQISLGSRAVGWYESDIQAWAASEDRDNEPCLRKPASGGLSIDTKEVSNSVTVENNHLRRELDDIKNRQLSTVRLMLEQHAKIGQRVSYDKVMKSILLSPDCPDDCKVMDSILEEVSRASHAERHLLLGVLVHEKPGLTTVPNQAFFDLATLLGYVCEDRLSFVTKHIVALYESFEDPSRNKEGKLIRVTLRGQTRLARER